jgi:hypothetical protein
MGAGINAILLKMIRLSFLVIWVFLYLGNALYSSEIPMSCANKRFSSLETNSVHCQACHLESPAETGHYHSFSIVDNASDKSLHTASSVYNHISYDINQADRGMKRKVVDINKVPIPIKNCSWII